MVQIIKILPIGFAANCYLVTADGKNAVAVDPAQPRVLGEAQKRGLQIRAVLLTHGHFDHIGGCAALQESGAKIGCLSGEESLALGAGNLARGMGAGEVPPFHVDFTVEDGQEISLCGVDFKVLATPGHTAYGACYVTDRTIFSGDTLFEGSVGRWDLPTGDGKAIVASVKKLYALAGDYTVCPGHGNDTTLDRERRENGVVCA